MASEPRVTRSKSAEAEQSTPMEVDQSHKLLDRLGSGTSWVPEFLQTWVDGFRNEKRQATIKARTAERKRRETEWSQQDAPPPQLQMINAPRFDPDDLALLAFLNVNGYVVVKGVANAAEVAQAKSLLWQFFESQADMRRDQPSSWTNQRFSTVGDTTTGIIGGNGIGQSEACWFVRTRPRVRRAFARVWGTEELITSFDGANAFRPFHARGAGAHRTMGGWWHVDQGNQKTGRHAVQGAVLLTAATEHTGGLCVVPGSHLSHGDLMSYTSTSPDGQDFVCVPSPHVNPAVRGGGLVRAEAGDLLLWDSRTVHCNTPALREPTLVAGYPDDELLRMVTYVCMTPRRLATAEGLSLRRRAVLAGVGSTHWPHEVKLTADTSCLEGIDEAALDEALRSGVISRDKYDLI